MPQSKAAIEVTEVKSSVEKQEDAQIQRWTDLVDIIRNSKEVRKSNEAYKEILASLKPRIHNLCRKFKIAGSEHDDLMQEAMVALQFKAIKDYDASRGRFDRFALLCIRRHLATELKTSYQNRKTVLNKALSLDQERSESNDDLSLINIIPQTEGDVLVILEDREYFTKLITKLLLRLSKFEREVFLLYIEKYSYEEIADIINNNRIKSSVKIKGVDNALSRIKNKAHVIFEKHGLSVDDTFK